MKISDALKETPVHNVLGLDISTNSVGYCLNTADGVKAYGEIVFQGNTVFERLADAQDKIRNHELATLDYDMILFESAVYIQNKRTVILLAYAYGAVLGALTKPGLRVADISPLEWQPAIGNPALTKAEKQMFLDESPGKSKGWYSTKYRDFRKKRTMSIVEKIYGIIPANDNIGDAIGISKVGVDTHVTTL